ncbi:MAG: PD40 domain-containing protein [Candidatus Aminicenantes bacterium]|nr:MAG: PD40 domain-containing protein [Candidatus Aminicenantes bacterium]
MNKSTYLVSSLAIILLLLTSCTKKDDFPVFKGPYLGQASPGSKPQLFMPGLVSTNYIDHCIGFLREGRVCVFSIWEKGTFYMYEKDGRWTQPEKVPWQNEQGTTDFTAAPDGNTIYFQSRRPTSPNDNNHQERNIWKVEWTGNDWIEPIPLPSPANTEEYSEAYPSVTPDGSMYYFTGSRLDSGIGDIYRSRFVDGKYLEAERLPAPINSYYYEVDPFVAPDGSYLLFGSDRPGGYGLMDLYISFRREDGSWTNPFNTGSELNPFCMPTRMSVTPDGKYFFFPSRQDTDVPKGEDFVSSNIEKWGDYDIYWVGTSFIDDLRDQYMGKKSAVEMIASEYQEQGILSATAMLSELYNTKQDSLYIELSEFMIFCGDLMRTGKSEDSEILYMALLKSIPEKFRIKQGYAISCILNGHVPKGLDLIKEMWAQFPSKKSEDMFLITFQLRQESRMDDELAVLQFITLEFPDSGLAHFWLADAHEHYGNIEEAVKSCMKALELKPGFEDAVEMQKRLKEE